MLDQRKREEFLRNGNPQYQIVYQNQIESSLDDNDSVEDLSQQFNIESESQNTVRKHYEEHKVRALKLNEVKEINV